MFIGRRYKMELKFTHISFISLFLYIFIFSGTIKEINEKNFLRGKRK